MSNLRILVASSSAVGIPILKHLLNREDVIGVISGPDKPKGRGRVLTPNEFSHFCADFGVEIHKPASHDELHALLLKLAPDLVVTVAYGRLIKSTELSIPKNGWLNVHFSLLPKWRGAAPVQYSIMRGDRVTGVTVFQLDEGMDTGPIYAQKSYEMQGDETTSLLLERLSSLSLPVIDQALDKITKQQPAVPQNEMGASLAPKISKADGHLNWMEESEPLERKIRALNPWPGAWAELNGKRLEIQSAKVAKGFQQLNPGELVISDGVYVKTMNGVLELLEVKPEGSRAMTAKEWVRGLQNQDKLKFV